MWAEPWNEHLVLAYRVGLAVGGYWFMYAQGARVEGDWWNPLTWLMLVLLVCVGAMALHFFAVFALAAAMIPIGIIDTVLSARRFRKGRVVTPRKEAPQAPPVAVPDEFWSPEPIIAWRRWRLLGTTLHGVRRPWPTALFQATCPTCKTVPGWDCTCGIYATKTEQRVWSSDPLVFGRVELSGHVIEHEDGYRAERARIVELFVPADLHPQIVAARYPDVTIHIVAPHRKAV